MRESIKELLIRYLQGRWVSPFLKVFMTFFFKKNQPPCFGIPGPLAILVIGGNFGAEIAR
jgi:hypothetical protein